MTGAPDPQKISGMTYAVHNEEFKRENRASWNKWDVVATAVVLSIVLGVYVYFSFWLDGSTPRATMWKMRNALAYGNTDNLVASVTNADEEEQELLRASCRYSYFAKVYNLAMEEVHKVQPVTAETTGLEDYSVGESIDKATISENGTTALLTMDGLPPIKIVKKDDVWLIDLDTVTSFQVRDSGRAKKLRAKGMGLQAGMGFIDKKHRDKGYTPEKIAAEICKPVEETALELISEDKGISDELSLLKVEAGILAAIKDMEKRKKIPAGVKFRDAIRKKVAETLKQ